MSEGYESNRRKSKSENEQLYVHASVNHIAFVPDTERRIKVRANKKSTNESAPSGIAKASPSKKAVVPAVLTASSLS